MIEELLAHYYLIPFFIMKELKGFGFLNRTSKIMIEEHIKKNF